MVVTGSDTLGLGKHGYESIRLACGGVSLPEAEAHYLGDALADSVSAGAAVDAEWERPRRGAMGCWSW